VSPVETSAVTADPAPAAPAAAASGGPGVLLLSLGATRLEAAVLRGDACQMLPGVVIAPALAGETGAFGPLLTALTALRVSLPTDLIELRVVVAERWLGTASLLWSNDLNHAATAGQQARLALISAGCEIGAGDVLRMDDARYGALRWVVSYPDVLLEGLRSLAGTLAAELTSVRPLAAAAWGARRALGVGRQGALALCGQGWVAVLSGAGRLTEVHSQALTDGQSPIAALQRLWARLQLRDPALAALPSLPMLQLDPIDAASSQGPQSSVLVATSAGTSAETSGLSGALWLAQTSLTATASLDAMPAPRPRGWRPWWPAAASAAVAVVLSVGAWQSFSAASAARAQWAAAQRATPAATALSPAWTREELARVRVVNQAVRELNLPIEALLAALQPPRDLPVSVLGVDVTGTAETGTGTAGVSTLRLQAEAGSAVDMARYVAFVGDRRPMMGAYLVRHEVQAAADGERRYRFTVEATWQD
jgi:hypothetical protein